MGVLHSGLLISKECTGKVSISVGDKKNRRGRNIAYCQAQQQNFWAF